MRHIEFHRRRKGWSQQELGDLVRIGQTFISMIERGRFLPTDDQRQRLANALDADPSRLLDEVVPAENANAAS